MISVPSPCGAVFILLKLLQAPEQQRDPSSFCCILCLFLFCLPSKRGISAPLSIRPSLLRISSSSWHTAEEQALQPVSLGLAPAFLQPAYQHQAPPATLTATSLLYHDHQLGFWSLISPISSRHRSSTDQIFFLRSTPTTATTPPPASIEFCP